MVLRWLQQASLRGGALGIVGLALAAPVAHGQCPPRYAPPLWQCPPSPYAQPPVCPAPMPAPLPPAPASDGKTPPPVPDQQANTDQGQQQQQPPAAEPNLNFGTNLASRGDTSLAPNMIGNLLMSNRSVSFFVNRASGGNFLNQVGSTSITNPKVADDNSPLPRDRFSFRYNFFSDANSVSGASSAPPTFDPQLLAFTRAGATKDYDVNQFTFQLEKTFFDGLASAEVRLPFARALSSKLDLSYGSLTSPNSVPGTNLIGQPVGLDALQVIDTPFNTLGSEDTEFGNMSVILKALAYQADHVAVSGGLGIGVPTGQDTRVRVTDFLGPFQFNFVDTQRIRDFHIENETWSLSPFVAVLLTPTDRFFTQAFLQFDFPLNSSKVTFTETTPNILNGAFLPRAPGQLTPPFSSTAKINEQILMQTDLGFGYWVLRKPEARWLTGIAPTMEIHYTTTLQNADVIVLPVDPAVKVVPVPGATPGTVMNLNPPAPTVGNLRNRVDILDVTFGTTFEVANQAQIATAFTVPTRGGDDKTFDWEFQIQFNYFFGGPARNRPLTPNF